MLDLAHQELLAQVASYYYCDELTQDEIATRLGLSRIKVYRLLKEARQEQIIQFTVDWPLQRDLIVERSLCKHFGLQEPIHKMRNRVCKIYSVWVGWERAIWSKFSRMA
jgi:DNA-binding transcriptional regulator LsrR (DeoR family)